MPLKFWGHTHTHIYHPQWIAVLIWPLRKTCQSAGPRLGLIILLQKSFEPSPIRGWTAVRGQRPVCLCGRTPANLAVESGWLPDFSGFLTASPVRLLAAPSCWTCLSARFTCLPVLLHFNPQVPVYLFCLLNLLNTIKARTSPELWERGDIFLIQLYIALRI